MEISTLHLSLPASLRDFVNAETIQGSFKSPEDYVTALLAAEQKRKLLDQLEGMALEGVNSGSSVEATQEFWEQRRRRIVDQFGAGKPS